MSLIESHPLCIITNTLSPSTREICKELSINIPDLSNLKNLFEQLNHLDLLMQQRAAHPYLIIWNTVHRTAIAVSCLVLAVMVTLLIPKFPALVFVALALHGIGAIASYGNDQNWMNLDNIASLQANYNYWKAVCFKIVLWLSGLSAFYPVYQYFAEKPLADTCREELIDAIGALCIVSLHDPSAMTSFLEKKATYTLLLEQKLRQVTLDLQATRSLATKTPAGETELASIAARVQTAQRELATLLAALSSLLLKENREDRQYTQSDKGHHNILVQ